MTKTSRFGIELIDRYKKNYSIPEKVDITEAMIIGHYELEKCLAKQLVESTLENRWETFDRCYSTLYASLEWLNKYSGSDVALSPEKYFSDWPTIIGKPPKNIYEIGSGKGDLIKYLASFGYRCKATEITKERGQSFMPTNSQIIWGTSDGVNLKEFEPINSYDVVLSNQVIEHLHPNDLNQHFQNCYEILRNNGRYIFTTPHKFAGSSDISRIFGSEKTCGMHLREYTYIELQDLLLKSGFKKIYATFSIPKKIQKYFHFSIEPRISNFYLRYLIFIEQLLGLLNSQKKRRNVVDFLKYPIFSPSIFIIAEK